MRRLAADRLAGRQFGVVSRAQALDCGLTQRSLQHRIGAGGRWQRILPGIYVASTGEPGPDQRLMAALLYAGEGSIITGQAALRHYKVRVPDARQVDILIPAGRRRSSREYVVVHRTRRMPRRYAAIGPIQFAPPARAVADAAGLWRNWRTEYSPRPRATCGSCSGALACPARCSTRDSTTSATD
ncbi:MAG: hypothetical protein ACRDRJ_36220 [Streptosporangiaceae bacterium]